MERQPRLLYNYGVIFFKTLRHGDGFILGYIGCKHLPLATPPYHKWLWCIQLLFPRHFFSPPRAATADSAPPPPLPQPPSSGAVERICLLSSLDIFVLHVRAVNQQALLPPTLELHMSMCPAVSPASLYTMVLRPCACSKDQRPWPPQALRPSPVNPFSGDIPVNIPCRISSKK